MPLIVYCIITEFLLIFLLYCFVGSPVFFFFCFNKLLVQFLSFLLLFNLLNQVRRTRISERMRKLQELVPNMDKVVIVLIWILFLQITGNIKASVFSSLFLPSIFWT